MSDIRDQARASSGEDSGSHYNSDLHQLLTANGFGVGVEGVEPMSNQTRYYCYDVMENLDAIEKWRAALPADERMQINHPGTVLRHWKRAEARAADGAPVRDRPKRTTIRILRDEVERLEGQGYVKDERIAELEKGIADQVLDTTGAVVVDPDAANFDRAAQDIVNVSESGAQRFVKAVLSHLPEERAVATATDILKHFGYAVSVEREVGTADARRAMHAMKMGVSAPIVRKRLSN